MNSKIQVRTLNIDTNTNLFAWRRIKDSFNKKTWSSEDDGFEPSQFWRMFRALRIVQMIVVVKADIKSYTGRFTVRR